MELVLSSNIIKTPLNDDFINHPDVDPNIVDFSPVKLVDCFLSVLRLFEYNICHPFQVGGGDIQSETYIR